MELPSKYFKPSMLTIDGICEILEFNGVSKLFTSIEITKNEVCFKIPKEFVNDTKKVFRMNLKESDEFYEQSLWLRSVIEFNFNFGTQIPDCLSRDIKFEGY